MDTLPSPARASTEAEIALLADAATVDEAEAVVPAALDALSNAILSGLCTKGSPRFCLNTCSYTWQTAMMWS